MLDTLIDDKDFAQVMQKNIENLIIHFFEKEQNFGILCKIDDVLFNPDLPQEIEDNFRDMTLFFLAGYTFETAHVTDGYLVFEAGFGVDNIGSVVSVPLYSIVQIIVDETPVLINLSTFKAKKEEVKKIDNNGVKNSMESFLSNPENSKFMKR